MPCLCAAGAPAVFSAGAPAVWRARHTACTSPPGRALPYGDNPSPVPARVCVRAVTAGAGLFRKCSFLFKIGIEELHFS